jgi:endonuclease YncB( thermonuclease family)
MDNNLYNYRAFVTGVYDGDSITVDIDLGFNNWMKNQKVRLYGINTPELRGEERPSGLIARDRLLLSHTRTRPVSTEDGLLLFSLSRMKALRTLICFCLQKV